MIVINKNTKIDDIEKNWISRNNEIDFLLKADSSFQIFAEAYAIPVLRELKESGALIKVTIPDSNFINQLISGKVESTDHPVFSIFGLQLIYTSSMICLQSNELEDVRQVLANTIWRFALDAQLIIGGGSRVQYISNHTHPVPMAFNGERKIKRYADYQKFKADISRKILDVWNDGDAISRNHLDMITGVAFHSAENAYDHARSYNGKKICGYYGITIEKLTFESKEKIKERAALPELLKDYLHGNFSTLNLGRDKVMRVQVLSVMDIGHGIQNTLKLNDSQTAVEIINRSFDDLVTSKSNIPEDEQPGFGLGDLVRLSRELSALIYLQSGEYELYYDFSDEPKKMSPEQKKNIDLIEIGKRGKKYGLNISLVWIIQSDKSQPSLLPE